MSSSDLPPTGNQLRYLRTLAVRAGQTFVAPHNRSQASAEIRRLRSTKTGGLTFAELDAKKAARETNGDAARVQPREITGHGSSATWSQRS